MHNKFLFVYGTLRKAFDNPWREVLDQYCKFFRDGTMQGKLYDINGFPGAIEHENSGYTIKGELYQLNNQHVVLSELDKYEGCAPWNPKPHLFTRKTLPVSLSCGNNVSAWTYIFNYDTEDFFEIISGDYLEFVTNNFR